VPPPVRDATARAVPRFAKDFPDDAELDALVAAFVGGNYAKVRRGATALAKSADKSEVRHAAAELLSRTKADPLSIYLFALAAVLLVVLSGYWVTHDNPPPPRPGPVERVK
jgi:hypothetical protein